MKTIKLIIFGFLLLFISACVNYTCTDSYSGILRVDGEKDKNISIKYIGPRRRGYNYEKDFGFLPKNKLPYYKDFDVITFCDTKDFKKRNYNFLEIKNTSFADIYICAAILGAETEKYYEIGDLLRIYNEQDKDPTYDYKKDPHYKNSDYLSKEDLYKKLLEDKYPYIIKLAPNKTCIMKWGGLGFQVIE